MKKGFTLIELLFVVVIIITLFKISANYFIAFNNSNIPVLIKADVLNFKFAMDKYYQNHFNFNDVDDFSVFRDQNGDGVADKGGINDDGKIDGIKMKIINPNDYISVKGVKCDKNDVDNTGYVISVFSSGFNNNKKMVFNSCVDSKPHWSNKK